GQWDPSLNHAGSQVLVAEDAEVGIHIGDRAKKVAVGVGIVALGRRSELAVRVLLVVHHPMRRGCRVDHGCEVLLQVGAAKERETTGAAWLPEEVELTVGMRAVESILVHLRRAQNSIMGVISEALGVPAEPVRYDPRRRGGLLDGPGPRNGRRDHRSRSVG